MRIETQRLLLREYADEDWRDVLAYQRDARFLRYYPWYQRTEWEVRQQIDMFTAWQKSSFRHGYQLAVTVKGADSVIGSCGIRRKGGKEWEAELGFELATAFWGRGLATEAARAMVEFGFSKLGLHRVSSWCIAGNRASARTLEKTGLRLEGRLLENEFFKGRWWDTLLYGTVGPSRAAPPPRDPPLVGLVGS